MPQRWVSKLTTLGLSLVAALIVGYWLGAVAWTLVAALAIYLAATLWRIYELDLVIAGRGRPRAFETDGFWPQIVANVAKLRSKSRARKKRYHRLLREVRESTAALSDAGVVLNSEREILWFNATANRMLGLDSARDLGQRIDNLIRHPTFVEYLDDPAAVPITIPSPVDESRMLAAQCIPYGQGQRLAIFRDVTRQMHLERTRRDFVANASHELRSPLTVITGYLDSLADDEAGVPAAWRMPIDEMQRQAERMTRILRDLIELTRLESVDGKAPREFVDIERLLQGIVAEFEARSAHPGLTLRLESDAALLGGESELHSIFFNLVANAIRFTPQDGRIDVVWRLDEGRAVFEVVDTGIGVPEEAIPRLTERFYRVDTSRSRATGGTGLGLAIVKHALQRHDGVLNIESTEGEGSRFSCLFEGERVVFRGGSAEAAL